MPRPPPLGNHIGHVIGIGAKEQMFRIDATGIIAVMTHEKFVRDGATMQFVAESMRKSRFPVYGYAAITKLVGSAHPLPTNAWGVLVNVGPKDIDWRFSEIVPFDKWNVLALDVSMTAIRVVRYWCELTASAHAQAGWIGAITGLLLAVIMSANVKSGLAFDPSNRRVIFGCYPCLLAATAMAIAVWNFVCGLFCGMIIHVDSLLSAIDRTTGCVEHRRGVFIGELHEYFTTITPTNQVGKAGA